MPENVAGAAMTGRGW